ncbi:Acetyl esterase/lipase [Collimonas sp. OK607]|nr:Acetyl esterase/lipase [Collimonas sp. OK607]
MDLIVAWISLLFGLLGMCFACCSIFARRGSLDRRSAWYTGFSAMGSELAPWLFLGALALASGAALLGANRHMIGRFGLGLHLLASMGLLLALWRARGTGELLEKVLMQGLGSDYASHIAAERKALLRAIPATSGWLRPFHYALPEVQWLRNLAYVKDGHALQKLDVLKPVAMPAKPMPILINFHGGAWIFGDKGTQGMPLLMHLAQNGWLVIDANYRLSPDVRMPEHLIDTKRVIAWAREHAAEYGGEPGFIAITGGSAGGHLCALAALTPNNPDWQPGFESADTQVQVAVPFYGKYDLMGQTATDLTFARFLADKVMQATRESAPDQWQTMDPASQINADAPPFMVLHGSHDSLIPVEEVRWFVQKLRKVSAQEVLYAEVPGAQHAWDVPRSLRCNLTVGPVQRFLEYRYAQWLRTATCK